MNPMIPIIVARVIAAVAGTGAAAVPTVSSGSLSMPVPATIEDGIIQAVLSVLSLAMYIYQSKKSKK